jgi:hypothetical protein
VPTRHPFHVCVFYVCAILYLNERAAAGSAPRVTVIQYSLTQWGHRDGLSNDSIWDLFEDREHNPWIGTQNGLNRLRNDKFSTLTRRTGLLSGDISSLAAASRLWAEGGQEARRLSSNGTDLSRSDIRTGSIEHPLKLSLMRRPIRIRRRQGLRQCKFGVCGSLDVWKRLGPFKSTSAVCAIGLPGSAPQREKYPGDEASMLSSRDA